MPPFGQTAFVLTDRPAFRAVLEAEPMFSGSLIVTATERMAGVGMGDTLGRLFAVPSTRPQSCWLSPFSPRKTFFVPHIAVGDGWTTRISLTNLCAQPNPVRFEVFDQAGALQTSFLPPQATLLPHATAVFFPTGTERSGPLTVRWARISSDLGLGVHILLELAPATPEVERGVVGVADSPVVTRFSLPVGVAPASGGPDRSLTVGLAVANTSGNTNSFVLQLLNEEGELVAQDSSLSLPPWGQLAVRISELPGFRAFLQMQPEFNGTLVVIATEPVAALGVGGSGPFFPIPPLVESVNVYNVPGSRP